MQWACYFLSMHRRIITAFLPILLVVSNFSPSHAIFGLSKCEKVEKQIRAWEQEEIEMIKRWNLNAKRLFGIPSSSERSTMASNWRTLVDLEVKMYGLQRNNSKCFTTTQKIHSRKGYKYWKQWQMFNMTAPDHLLGTSRGRYIEVIWNSIYNQ
jgi:hypothetical protein